MSRSNSTWKWNKLHRKNKPEVNSQKENRKEFLKINRLMLKSQQRFKSKKKNIFTEEVIKVALSTRDDQDDKRMQATDSIDSYEYGASKNQKCKNEETKCDTIITQYKKLTLTMLQEKT